MMFSEFYKFIVKKDTFASFRGVDRPNRPPLDPPLRKIITFCLTDAGFLC